MSHNELQKVFDRFGWEVTPEFIEKYHNDPWVYNLTNALIRTSQNQGIESGHD